MDTAAQTSWTAAAFLAEDQESFGPAWRYELVDGRIISHAAPAPDHGAILSGLIGALTSRMPARADGCRPEIGSGATPRQQQRPTARIPDATIRCGDLPRVLFEVVSPSELRAWRARDRKRHDLQDVAGVMEIVEIYQREAAIHVYRREADDQWLFEAINGVEETLTLRSVDLSIPLAEIYKYAVPNEAAANEG